VNGKGALLPSTPAARCLITLPFVSSMKIATSEKLDNLNLIIYPVSFLVTLEDSIFEILFGAAINERVDSIAVSKSRLMRIEILKK
jgi:hypothetical protein